MSAEVDPFKYSSWPMNASVQAWRLTQDVERRLAALERAGRMGQMPPILAMQSAVDSTVIVPKLIAVLFDRLPPGGPSELVLFDVNRVAWLGNLVDRSFEREIRPRLERTDLPFKLTLVVNAATNSLAVKARHAPAVHCRNRHWRKPGREMCFRCRTSRCPFRQPTRFMERPTLR